MRVDAGAATDVGRVRQGNEDAYLVDPPLFAVADGMGGHNAGEVASATTIEVLERWAQEGEHVPEALRDAIGTANRAVWDRAQSDPSLQGMGTTCTAALVQESVLHIAHVGDSRAYLLRDGTLEQITEDHTLVERMVKEGRITRDQAEHHPQRSVITRALGIGEDVRVDETKLDLRPGDRILLCSDGLNSMVPTATLESTLRAAATAGEAAQALVGLANEAGGEDNITVIVLDVDDDHGRAPTTVRSSSAAPAPPLPTRGSKKLLLVLGVGAAVLLALFFVLRYSVTNLLWFVGVDDDGTVTIYNGLPESIAGLDLRDPYEATDLDIDDLPDFVRDDLLTGHRVSSLEEAEEYVINLEERAEEFAEPAGAAGSRERS